LVWLPLLAVLIFWQAFANALPASQFFLSSPLKVFAALWEITSSGQILIDTTITVTEAILGFLIGTVLGTLAGLSLWYWPRAAHIGNPYVAAISAIPPFALAPLVILWFGIGIFAKVMVAALATVFVATAQTYNGARTVNEHHLRLVRIMGGTRWHEFTKVVVPTAVQSMVNSMRLNVGFALTGAFVGEYISAERGLGYFIVRSAALYNMSRVLAGCVMLMLVAVGLNSLVSVIETRLVRCGFRYGT
jgi:NitT/TauT family transport system permease protein